MNSIVKNISYAALVLVLFSCSESNKLDKPNGDKLSFSVSTEIVEMESEAGTKVNYDGDAFQVNDLIRLKMITPYDNGKTQFGESSWAATQDNFFLLKFVGGNDWSNSLSSFGFDIDGDGKTGDNGPSLQYLAQQTPYVYTANTWSRCLNFKVNGAWKVMYKSIFYADQTIKEQYLASDYLWAQTVTQTGTDMVFLSFHHVMGCLVFNLDFSVTAPEVFLAGMPDIDQQEIIVGNKYANKDINYGNAFSNAKISYVTNADDNGKVLGIGLASASKYDLVGFEDASIKEKGMYVAYKENNTTFRVIVPPVAVSNNMKIIVKDGINKYEFPLKDNLTEIKQGNCYSITLKK